MTASTQTLMTLTTVPTELEGELLVQLLEEHAIPATASGGMTSEFRAEAPGVVEVMVMQDRFSEARSIIEKQEAAKAQSRSMDQVSDASDYVPSLTKFGFWALIIGNILALIAILALL